MNENVQNSKAKLIETLKRLDFTVNEFLERKFAPAHSLALVKMEEENTQLKRQIEILLKENRELKEISTEFMNDVDFAIKVTENIINRLKNENKSE